jgi:hypothetical protein
MDRIVLFENNEMLRYRIENILSKTDDISVDFFAARYGVDYNVG